MDSLSLAQVLAAYEASLAQVFTRQSCTVTGTLEPKNHTPYSGRLYWYLVDGGARLTVQIPERSRSQSSTGSSLSQASNSGSFCREMMPHPG